MPTLEKAPMNEALRKTPLFAEWPQEELDRIEPGEELRLEAGEWLVREGDPDVHFLLLLEGKLRITQRAGDQDVYLLTYDPGTFFGEIPLLLNKPHIASAQALVPCHVYRWKPEQFWQLMTRCRAMTHAVMRMMAYRLKQLQEVDRERRRLLSLGTLAAGLAHEMNNPAAGVARGAVGVGELLDGLAPLTLQLAARPWTGSQLEALADLRCRALEAALNAPTLDPVLRSDREEQLARALEEVGVPNAWEVAPQLAEAGLGSAWIEELRFCVPAAAIPEAVAWVQASLSGAALVKSVRDGSTRISDLVEVLRGYSYLDQATVGELDIHEGLERTLSLLTSRLRGIDVHLEFDRTVPMIEADGLQLNEVWTQLLQNAIQALPNGGRINLYTWREGEWVGVEVRDNGPGIPAEIQGRIFDPFFTTRDVGDGIGMGLNLSYRIVVGMHGGDLRVSSRPGDTRFQVRLPLKKQSSA